MTIEIVDKVEDQVSLRQRALTILFKKFGNHQSIYECADEWVTKQVTTNGIVDYYKAYFLPKLDKT
jgi:hypothetical protein